MGFNNNCFIDGFQLISGRSQQLKWQFNKFSSGIADFDFRDNFLLLNRIMFYGCYSNFTGKKEGLIQLRVVKTLLPDPFIRPLLKNMQRLVLCRNDFFKQKKYPEAVNHYTEALRRNPKDPKGGWETEIQDIHLYLFISQGSASWIWQRRRFASAGTSLCQVHFQLRAFLYTSVKFLLIGEASTMTCTPQAVDVLSKANILIAPTKALLLFVLDPNDLSSYPVGVYDVPGAPL
ncbi:hypothetical protein C5167_047207 [Papaver somniferum]|uniref:Uncharacterized protein n=1 Tax=Papaver somniferum TaxID=3469 RepID=A0A4Y7LJK7_PAPSO|nr:hypothetical protein C5167_047207 [Papaver somniferum]